jgi:hypothetical protein
MKDDKGFPIMDLPTDMQRHVLGAMPLCDLARMACLSKELRVVYLDRVKKRDDVVADLLESQFTEEFREGLSTTQTSLPRDLIVEPPVR